MKNLHIRPTLFTILIIPALLVLILLPSESSSAHQKPQIMAQTPSPTTTSTQAASQTPTVTSTATITPTPTQRPGTHVPKASPLIEIQIGDALPGPLAFSSRGLLAVGVDGGVRIYETRNYSLKKQIQLSYAVDQLEFSPDGKYLAASMHYTGNSKLQPYITSIWETTKWNLTGSVTDGKGALTALSWDHDSRIILVGRDNPDKNHKALFLWYANGAAVSAVESPAITSLLVSDDNRQIIAGGKDGYLYIYNFKTGELIKRISAGRSAITGLGLYKPDWISATTSNGEVIIWNELDEPIYRGDLAAATGYSTTPDRRALVFCSRYGVLIEFDLTSEDSFFETDGGRCTDTAFSVDGSSMAVSFTDGIVRVFQSYTEGNWNASPAPTLVPSATQTFPKITPAVVLPEDKSAIQPSNFHKLQILQTGIPLDELMNQTRELQAYPLEWNGPGGTTWSAYSPDGDFKAIPEGSKVTLTRVQDQKSYQLDGTGVKLNTLAFSPVGDFIAAGAVDGGVRIWKWKDQNVVCDLFSTPVLVKSVKFNWQGTMLAVGYDNRTIEVYELLSCSRIAQMPRNTRQINDLMFSPDGIYLASAASDNLALLFYLPSQKMIRKLEPDHRVKGLNSVAYNPYQTILAVGTAEGYVTLWNVNSAEYLDRYLIGTRSNPVATVLFSADGKQIFACLKDKTCSILGFDK